ncbi:hypothetical protein CCP3SC15_240032 [Gammaproteobacteria bacterium]
MAYAQGTDIHIAPGQERHLAHEAWHVVQQAQGRVRPTTLMMNGTSVNDDKGLEREADMMGERAIAKGKEATWMEVTQCAGEDRSQKTHLNSFTSPALQRIKDFDFSYNDIKSDEDDEHKSSGGFSFPLWPKKGDLKDETETKYEKKLPENTPRYNYYYGIEIEGEKEPYGKIKSETSLTKHRYHPYQKVSFPGMNSFQFPIQKVLKNITLRSTGVAHDFDYTLGGNYNIDFSNNTAAGNYDPGDHASQVDLETGCAIPGHGVTLSGNVVDIAPNGSRAQHFSIADRLNPVAAAARPRTWTWHHLDNEYDMVLVDSAVHNPGYGGFFHYGGMAFWT